jgi:hypothetical protein
VWDLFDDPSLTAYWLVSVSDDSDPMGNWCNFAFPAHLNGMTNSLNWGDYPKAGYDDQAVYISGRQFTFNTGSGYLFQYCKLRIIPKSELYATNCGPVNYTDFWNFRDPSNPSNIVDGPPIAAVHLDSPANKAYIVVDADYFPTSTFITLWTLDDPLGNPTLAAVNIPTAAAPWPNNGNQLGGGTPRIDVGRRAYRNAVYKDDQLWTSCPIGGGAGNAYTFARYVRLDVVNQTLLEDAALGANGFYYLYPAAMVDEDNNLVMVFSRSADTEYVGAAFTGRREGDPPGLAPSVMLKEGEGNYVVTFSGTRNRWGDYMGIALDPQYPAVIWGMAEYAAAVNTWGNWIGAFAYRYTASGIVKDAVSGNPIEFAQIEVMETGRKIETDSTGAYSFGTPTENVTLNVSAFAYRDTTITLTLTPNVPGVLDILMQPEIEATISGQVLDPASGSGIVADLEFYPEGNPYPGPYLTTSTDPNGNYSVSTIIGTYDLVVKPVSPYALTQIDSLVLDVSGLNYNIEILPADVLLVDDDRGSDYEQYYIASLEEIAITYHLWDTQTDGIPGAAQMAEFPSKAVVWYTGDTTAIPLSQAAQTELLSHLNNDGKLFLTGQDIAETIHGSGLLNELGVAYLQDNVQLVIRGTAGTIMNGLIMVNSGTGGANNQFSRDQLDIINPATTQQIFQYGAAATSVAGVSYLNGEAKAVLLGFG